MSAKTVRWVGFGFLTILIVLLVSVTGVIAWWMADRKPPVDLLDTRVNTKVVAPGEWLSISQDLVYHRDCGAHIDRAIFDSHTHRQYLEDVDYRRPPLGVGPEVRTVTFRVRIPENFQDGEGKYVATPIYDCNPLQRYYWPITRDDTVVYFYIKSSR